MHGRLHKQRHITCAGFLLKKRRLPIKQEGFLLKWRSCPPAMWSEVQLCSHGGSIFQTPCFMEDVIQLEDGFWFSNPSQHFHLMTELSALLERESIWSLFIPFLSLSLGKWVLMMRGETERLLCSPSVCGWDQKEALGMAGCAFKHLEARSVGLADL